MVIADLVLQYGMTSRFLSASVQVPCAAGKRPHKEEVRPHFWSLKLILLLVCSDHDGLFSFSFVSYSLAISILDAMVASFLFSSPSFTKSE